jgi:Arc/MetJ-type ribon-helix-helix transcriptional regulator
MVEREEKRKDNYGGVRLPKSILDEAKKLIGRGFTSEAEVVKQALREYLDECYRRGIIQ